LRRSAETVPPFAWALAATVYWGVAGVLLMLSYLSTLVLLGCALAFVLLLWATRDGAAARPSRRTLAWAALSAVYLWLSVWIVGIAAYIDSHGCAVAPTACEGIGLMDQVAALVLLLYFLICWVALRQRNVLQDPDR
jgi:hypothetical protein